MPRSGTDNFGAAAITGLDMMDCAGEALEISYQTAVMTAAAISMGQCATMNGANRRVRR